MKSHVVESETNISGKPKVQQQVDLVIFDEECDDLGQFNSSNYESQVYKEEQSVISDQTEKKKKQIRQKINNYLNKKKLEGQPIKNNKLFDFDDQEPDRALIDELGSIEHVQKQNRQVEQFILAFNKNPENAINDYIKRGIIQDEEPQSIAKYIIEIQGIDKVRLGEYFGKNDPKVLSILRAYCKYFKFYKIEYDKAIRKLLSQFRLPGQAQQVQRIVQQFSEAYYEINKEEYANASQLFPLAYSIIMLATDAHNPKQQRKMTKEQFIRNTQGPCPSITIDYLSGIYDRITKEKLQTLNSQIESLYVKMGGISIVDIKGAFDLAKDLMKGDIFLKACKNTNKFVQRKIYLSPDKEKIEWICDPPKSEDQESRFIFIKDITDLTIGLGSAVMQKNKVPQHFDPLCFTIGTVYRTLDLKSKTNKERAKWVNYIRAILIQRRHEKKQQIEKDHQLHLSRQKVQEIWNTDIFPHWDKHWDYKIKKPKEKGYIARGLQAICCCFSKKAKYSDGIDENGSSSGLKVKLSLLDTLWKLGLPQNSRKTLWPLVIGNNLALTQTMIEQVKKRKRKQEQVRKFYGFSPQVIQMTQIVRQFRPDLPAVRDLVLMSEVFHKAIPKTKNSNPLNSFINLIHMHHFLIFYRGQKAEIQLRIQMFEFLLQKNIPKVWNHFQALRLETRMYLVSWFLSIFCHCFHKNQEFLLRIWDNFLLDGEIYLFKVGLAIIKYYEVQLKMCTFHEGLQILRFPKQTSPVLLFQILQTEIQVKDEHYLEYIEKRKHAIIKTKVQMIPLE